MLEVGLCSHAKRVVEVSSIEADDSIWRPLGGFVTYVLAEQNTPPRIEGVYHLVPEAPKLLCPILVRRWKVLCDEPPKTLSIPVVGVPINLPEPQYRLRHRGTTGKARP